jgi:hypothetical protein
MRLRNLLVAIAAQGAVAMPAAAADVADDFARALLAPARSPEIRPDEDIYADLVGEWEVRTRDLAPDGTYREGHGEWIFVRTLEGRAMQDVWISPPRGERQSAGHFANRYGNSIRTFDPVLRRWQVTWLNPVSGAFDVLYARREGGKLIQEGRRPDGQAMRWIFQELTPSSFRWTGEGQQPDGTWRLEAEFRGQRRHAR